MMKINRNIIKNIKEWVRRAPAFLIAFLLPVIALAQPRGGLGGGGITFQNPINQDSILGLVNVILNFVVQVGVVVSVLFLVYAGFLFVFARGNQSVLDQAKQTFFWTIVGAVIVLGAFVLSEIIRDTANKLGASV